MTPELYPVALGFIFPERDLNANSLVSQVNSHILAIKADSELTAKLREPWFGSPPTAAEQAETLNWTVAGPCLAIIILYCLIKVYHTWLEYEEARSKPALSGESQGASASASDVHMEMADKSASHDVAALAAQLAHLRNDVRRLLELSEAKAGETTV